MPAYATNNSMVWEYLAVLRRISQNIPSISDEDERRQNIAVCVVMSVAVAETFVNAFFGLKVKEPGFAEHKPYLLKCLADHESLDYKIKNWPNKVLNKNLDLTSGIGKRFSELKHLRNKLMHFTLSDQPVSIDDREFPNLVDIGFYHTLRDSQAIEALDIAQAFIQSLLTLSGLAGPELVRKMLYWTGRPPA